MLRSENCKLKEDMFDLSSQLEGERKSLQDEASKVTVLGATEARFVMALQNLAMKREIESLRSDQTKLVLEKESMIGKISSLETEYNELRSNFSEARYLADQRRKILDSTLERLAQKATSEDKEEIARKEWEAEVSNLDVVNKSEIRCSITNFKLISRSWRFLPSARAFMLRCCL
eukprot:768261-Hanusia_phi.AAC.8